MFGARGFVATLDGPPCCPSARVVLHASERVLLDGCTELYRATRAARLSCEVQTYGVELGASPTARPLLSHCWYAGSRELELRGSSEFDAGWGVKGSDVATVGSSTFELW